MVKVYRLLFHEYGKVKLEFLETSPIP